MIIGSIQDIQKYSALSKNFKTAIEYIQATDMSALSLGKHIIDGDQVFLIRDCYQTKKVEDCFFESHEKYADIQIVLSGQEGFGYLAADTEGIVITEPYLEDKDMTKYDGIPEFIYTLKKDRFAIVFPEDLHMVKINNMINNEKIENEKVVIKVMLTEY